jgi:hypothetical protein
MGNTAKDVAEIVLQSLEDNGAFAHAEILEEDRTVIFIKTDDEDFFIEIKEA